MANTLNQTEMPIKTVAAGHLQIDFYSNCIANTHASHYRAGLLQSGKKSKEEGKPCLSLFLLSTLRAETHRAGTARGQLPPLLHHTPNDCCRGWNRTMERNEVGKEYI